MKALRILVSNIPLVLHEPGGGKEVSELLCLILHLTGTVGKSADTLLNCPNLFQSTTTALYCLNWDCGPNQTHVLCHRGLLELPGWMSSTELL